jgi:hypothetical protein
VGFKIALTGWLFSLLLLVPAIFGRLNIEPQIWVKAIILIPGTLGIAFVFIGLIVAIWDR